VLEGCGVGCSGFVVWGVKGLRCRVLRVCVVGLAAAEGLPSRYDVDIKRKRILMKLVTKKPSQSGSAVMLAIAK